MKKQILLALMLVISGVLFSQNVRYVTTGEKMKEKRLVSPTFIGEIDDNIYVATRSLTTHKRNLQEDLKLSVYNKETNRLVKSKSIKGFGNKKCFGAIKDAAPNNCIVRNSNIYVSWVIKTKTETKLLLQIFDKELVELQKPRVVYQLANVKKAAVKAHLFFIMSQDGQKIAIGGEESVQKGEDNLNLQYKIFDLDMEVLNSVQVELPYSITRYSEDISSDYELSDAGLLYFSTGILFKEENKKTGTYGYIIGAINPATSAITTAEIAIKGKKVETMSYDLKNNVFNVYGLATEKKKVKNSKKKEYDQYSFYSVKVNAESLKQIGELKEIEFDESKIAYSDFQMSKKEKEKYSADEFTLSNIKNLVIMDRIETEDNGLLISMNSQYFYTVCTQSKYGTTCTPYTSVEGRFYMKLNSEGDFSWISCCQQDLDLKGYVYPKNKLNKSNDSYCAIVEEGGKSNALFAIDEKSGQITKKIFPKEYRTEILESYGNKFYYLGLERKLSQTGLIGTCASVATLPLGVGLFGIIIFPNYKRNNVYFGSFNL